MSYSERVPQVAKPKLAKRQLQITALLELGIAGVMAQKDFYAKTNLSAQKTPTFT